MILSMTIVEKVADYYNVTPAQILGKRRSRHIAIPRMVCAFLMRNRNKMSVSRIGKQLNRDHSTISHATASIIKRRRKDRELSMQIDLLTEELFGIKEKAMDWAA